MIQQPTHTTHPFLRVATAVVGILAAIFMSFALSHNVSAADGRDFRPGRIIDDNIFYNSNALSASQVQSFLNDKVPTCDTNGTGTATEFGSSLTRAEYAASRGWHAPPYICLKDFSQNTPQVEAASQLCSAIDAKTNRTAAQIIADVAVACGINPQVLVVLLQKEQSLVTDIWPLSTQYKYATGFACPDTAACNDAYSGFFMQVYSAAKQYKIYKLYPNSYNYIAGANNTVKWNPLSSCGTSTFYIENQATAGLYIYTPYRPNQAALDNLYGSGDGCSSYGNRNFWRWFTDWFGPTTGPLISSSGLLLYGWRTGDPITAVFDIKNTTKSTINVDYIRVRATNQFNDQYLFWAKDNLTLEPGQRYTYKQTINIDLEGDYTFIIDRKIGSTWISPPFSDFNFSGTTRVDRSIINKPTVDASLQLDKTSVHVNEPVTASFDVTNNSALHSVNVGLLKAEAFDSKGNQYQFGSSANNLSLSAGETYNYSGTVSFPKKGTYPIEIINKDPNVGWNNLYPISDDSSIVRKINLSVKDQLTLTQGLSITPADIRAGDTMTATFKIKNFGTTSIKPGRLKVEAFGPNNTQYQFPATDENLTIAPGQEYTYSQTLVSPGVGSYTFRIVNKSGSIGWNTSLPTSETSGLARSTTVTVNYPVNLTSSLSITPTNPSLGATVTATFTIQNFGTTSVTPGAIKVEAFNGSTQYQFGSTDASLTLDPDEVYNYSETLTLNTAGTYNFRIVNKSPTIGWNLILPVGVNGSILRTQTVVVN